MNDKKTSFGLVYKAFNYDSKFWFSKAKITLITEHGGMLNTKKIH